MKNITLLVFLFFLIYACRESGGRPAVVPQQRDTAITVVNSYSERFFDSTQLESYIQRTGIADTLAAQLRDFYNVRNYQYAWIADSGLNEQARNLWNLQSNYISYNRDSSLFNPFLQSLIDSLHEEQSTYVPADSTLLHAELDLTVHFFRYASKAYTGRRDIEPSDVKWFIPRKKADILAMLDSIVSNGDVERYEPVNRQYGLLRKFLQRYSTIRDEGGWNEITFSKKVLETGDSLSAVAMIKRRLHLTDDYTSPDTSHIFTDSLARAIEIFQRRMGIQVDRAVGPTTLRHLNKSLKERVRQLLVNMERMRWLPAEPATDYILVNIPEFRLHAYENGRYAFNMNVVVGTSQNRTVIFTDRMKYVVFSPYWNVPPGILKNEVLPGIEKNPNYLQRHNMEWHNGYVRQKPGPNNSLGLVKFLFPNSYNIYLHDSPAKSLFKEDARAFSHGCIRVAEPAKLAEWVLRNDSSWTTQRIYSAMHAGEEKYVTLKEELPVYIGYFTAWVDRQGRLNFRDDIYGHDKLLAEKLFAD